MSLTWRDEEERQVFDKDIAELRAQERVLRTKRNNISPACCLPTELLWLVFQEVQKSCILDSCLCWMAPMTAICRAWRNVALGDSFLWRKIMLDRPHSVPEFLIRSRNVSVSLVLARWLHFDNFPSDDVLNWTTLGSTLVENWDRVSHVLVDQPPLYDISSDGWEEWHLFCYRLVTRLPKHPPPCLQSVRVIGRSMVGTKRKSVHRPTLSKWLHGLVFGGAPELREVILVNYDLEKPCKSFSPGLTHLALTGVLQSSGNPCKTGLHDILGSCNQLAYLALNSRWIELPGPSNKDNTRYRFPNLKGLSLSVRSALEVDILLNHIHCSPEIHLNINLIKLTQEELDGSLIISLQKFYKPRLDKTYSCESFTLSAVGSNWVILRNRTSTVALEISGLFKQLDFSPLFSYFLPVSEVRAIMLKGFSAEYDSQHLGGFLDAVSKSCPKIFWLALEEIVGEAAKIILKALRGVERKTKFKSLVTMVLFKVVFDCGLWVEQMYRMISSRLEYDYPLHKIDMSGSPSLTMDECQILMVLLQTLESEPEVEFPPHAEDAISMAWSPTSHGIADGSASKVEIGIDRESDGEIGGGSDEETSSDFQAESYKDGREEDPQSKLFKEIKFLFRI